jgi:hypothetical protein
MGDQGVAVVARMAAPVKLSVNVWLSEPALFDAVSVSGYNP